MPRVESSAATFLLPGVPGTFPIELSLAEGRAESEPKLIAGSFSPLMRSTARSVSGSLPTT